jgi:TolB-like protein/Tfp pilus assembly protein PilF
MKFSVYFDENPIDGLLETHDVDKSLEGKLKCLIFIPIISQTYCDPKSFAWKQEFLVFNRLAKEDQYGRDIKLTSGNVASRILPVRIHELDSEDKSLLESELQGALRGVEFIYRSTGVNRPLKQDDDRKGNLNKTYYRDQINKVANTVKEIISAMKSPVAPGIVVPSNTKAYGQNWWVNNRRKIAIISASVLLTTVMIYFLYSLYSAPVEKSIAVIPFVDLSEEKDQEYVCDGLTEEILSHLSKIEGLRVISRTSCMKYKGTKSSIKEIAEELGVTNILEGSIRKVGNHVRVTVQLIDAIPDKHMWANDYDFEDLKDIFSLHTKVSTDVASVLKGKLTTQEKALLASNYTVDPEAYRLYKRGRVFWAVRTSESYDSAEYYYKRAIDLDPNYALAYAGLADCYIYGLQGMSNIDEVQVAKAYLSKALALDSTLCEALTTKGFIESHTEHNWTKGEKTLEAAIRQNPNYSLAHLYHGNISIFTGKQIQKGLDEVKLALELDPLSPSVNWALGARYQALERNNEAIVQYQRTIALDNKNAAAKTWMALGLIRSKRFGEAFEVLQTVPKPFEAERDILIAYAHSEMGEKEKARSELATILSAERKVVGERLQLAYLYISLNDFDAAVTQLELGYNARSHNLLRLKIAPSLDPLRNMPRFKAILAKMNFE